MCKVKEFLYQQEEMEEGTDLKVTDFVLVLASENTINAKFKHFEFLLPE
jgi:hypothetical protein